MYPWDLRCIAISQISNRKAKSTNKCVIKQEIKFKDWKKCLECSKTIPISQQRFKSKFHNEFTEKMNKVTVRENDDKRLQTFDWVILYPYDTSLERVCKGKLIIHPKIENSIKRLTSMKLYQKIHKDTNHVVCKFLTIHTGY